MDDIVVRGMAKWPNVPAVYGWLSLDRRGNWLLKDPASDSFGRIGNAALRAFIGRNYAAHAREMGSDPTREPPFFFQKPTDAIQNVAPGTVADHPYPTLTKNYHYEVELVAALHKGGRNVTPAQSLDLVYAYTIGLDMTRRDLQRAMGDEKKPWEIGKSFDHSAVLGPLHPASQIGHFTKGAIWLKVNGNLKQNADLNQMIWNVAEQISKLSEAFELMAGDIIYSGTPANVGPVVRGDVIDCHIDGLPNLGIKIV